MFFPTSSLQPIHPNEQAERLGVKDRTRRARELSTSRAADAVELSDVETVDATDTAASGTPLRDEERRRQNQRQGQATSDPQAKPDQPALDVEG